MDAQTSTGDPGDGRGQELARLSSEMVRLYKEQFGRGPTRAASQYAGPDTLVCTLENSLTPAERRMAEMGEHQRLRDIRLFIQHASEARFKDAVTGVAGREVARS